MNTFPLIRNKWSNEHVMAAVFGILILYLLPSWLQNPAGITGFLAVLAGSLIIDTTANMIRYKRPVCSVSAAVTAGIFGVLVQGVPLWGQLTGIAAALILGKHIWGGTGKNPVNPAMAGVLLTGIVFRINEPVFEVSVLLLPAFILSIPFIMFRPYASTGFLAGMLAATFFRQDLGFVSILAYGGIFFACLILTDPVTITGHSIVGAAGGLITGFLTLLLSGSVTATAAGILIFNVVSAAAANFRKKSSSGLILKSKIDKIIPYSSSIPYVDLTEKEERTAGGTSILNLADSLSKEEILRRIEAGEVFGMGGAAFPTIEKIRTVMDSGETQKHLIINGAECDPGLLHDRWLLENSMKEICAGADILKKCIDFDTVTLTVKEGTEINCTGEIEIKSIPDCYPVGAERALIGQVLEKELSKNDIPAKEGILVLNVQTVQAIYVAVSRSKKTDARLITVADMKNKSAYIVKVRLGAKIQSIVEALKLGHGNYFVGGGAMQCRNADEEDVVDKTVNFIALGDFPRYKESPLCSRCGFCRSNCPAGIMVDRIAELADKEEWKEAKWYEPDKCIQCGNCSRVCLAGRNLAARVKAAKACQ